MALHFGDKPLKEQDLPTSAVTAIERVLENKALFQAIENITKIAEQIYEPMRKLSEATEKLTEPMRHISRAIEQINSSFGLDEMQKMASRFADLHANLLPNWGEIIRAYDILKPPITDEESVGLPAESEIVKTETVRDAIIAVGVEATLRLEKTLPKRQLRLGMNHRLYDRQNLEVYVDLSDPMFGLANTLRKRLTQTPVLTEASKYKNDATTRRGIQRFNQLGYTKFNLAGSIVVGDKDSGYRFAKFVNVKL